jgi:RraA family protein
MTSRSAPASPAVTTSGTASTATAPSASASQNHRPLTDLPLPDLDWLTSTLLADVGAFAMASRIHPVDAESRVYGPALTVSVPPGDNLAIHLALTLGRPGDVLIVDGQGYTERALMGGIMCTQAKATGFAGVIVDGAIRDQLELKKLGLPVFAAASHPAGPTKKGDGAVLHAVVCAGAPVAPGDWIFGDADGVAVLPAARKGELLAKARAKFEREQARMDAIAAGALTPPWLEGELAKAEISVGQRPEY